jgi:hypothetical protein
MNARPFILALVPVVSCLGCPGEAGSPKQESPEEMKAAMSVVLEGYRKTGVLQDMRRYGLVTNVDAEITWPELYIAIWKMKADHPPLGIEPASWERIPAPDLRGTNDPGGVQTFIRTNGWNMGQGVAGAAWGLVKTKPIRGLPWDEIKHREFEAITADGILYVIFDGFHHSMYGVAFNPRTNRFDPHLVGFSPIGDHWYAWRQPEDPMKLPQRYEGGREPTGQPVAPANGSQPFSSETNQTSSAAGSRR